MVTGRDTWFQAGHAVLKKGSNYAEMHILLLDLLQKLDDNR